MEPRISSLLVDPRLLDRNLFEQFSIPAASSRPFPVEPSHVTDELQIHQGNSLAVGASRNGYRHAAVGRGGNTGIGALQPLRPRPALASPPGEEGPKDPYDSSVIQPRTTATSAIPLAGVLNSVPEQEAPIIFSGSLQDLLPDAPRKRRRLDGSLEEEDAISRAKGVPAGTGPTNSLLTLPKPQPAKKGLRRQRIPPLLQGLHHPPPDAGLFPRITDRPEEVDGTNVGQTEDLRSDSKSNQTRVEPPAGHAEALVSERSERSSKETKKDEQKTQIQTQTYPVKVKSKRHKWSEQETKDMLLGVARFGIGSWAKILACPDYRFENRSAVDLKDRFRTCCPDEYKNYRAGKNTTASSSSKENLENAEETRDDGKTPQHQEVGTSKAKRNKKLRCDNHRKTASDLAEIGINSPFKKKERRERRGFSQEEDDALLRGYLKHGPRAWHLIQKDSSLELDHRTPTDLRDRFRNRYPEKYQEAGYKVKSKPATKTSALTEHSPTDRRVEKSIDAKGKRALNRISPEPIPHVPMATKPSATQSQPDPGSKPQEPSLRPIQTNLPAVHLPSPFNVMNSDEDDSPVVLSRNIMQWAATNPPAFSQPTMQTSTQHDATPLSATATAPGAHAIGTSSGNISSYMDGLHINPQAMTLSSSSQPAISNTVTLPVIWKKSSANPSVPPLHTLILPINPSAGTQGSGKATYLPPPADLLSGIELDGSRDGQSAGFWDDLTLPPL